MGVSASVELPSKRRRKRLKAQAATCLHAPSADLGPTGARAIAHDLCLQRTTQYVMNGNRGAREGGLGEAAEEW